MTDAVEQEDKKDSVKTICRDCIFAQWEVLIDYEAGDHSKTQVGCTAGRLDKFENTVTKTEEHDHVISTYVQIPRFCNLCRNSKWKKPEESDLDCLTRAYEEAQVQCEAIIYFHEDSKLHDLEHTLKSVTNQLKVKFLKTIIVVKNEKVKITDIIQMCRAMPGISKWNVDKIKNTEMNDKEVIDHASRLVKSTYYTLIFAGNTIPPNFLSLINYSINVDMKRIVLCRVDVVNDQAIFVSKLLHRMFGGHAKQDFIEATKRLAKEQECPEAFLEFSQL